MADGNEARGARSRLAALVIDDHEPGRLLASLVLEHFGLTVDTAVDATDGAARVRRKAYDIVLIDRVLGDEDGLALATRLAAETPCRRGDGVRHDAAGSDAARSGRLADEAIHPAADVRRRRPRARRIRQNAWP